MNKSAITVLLLATTAAVAPAWAQSEPVAEPQAASQDSGDVLQDIVVTASRRETRLQDVGIAVSAFGGDTLRNLSVTSSHELASVTPGLQLNITAGSPLVGLMSIRGVSQNDFAGHIEAPNAFYVDEVYQPSISSSAQQLFDVERVEVLKGPQGTLFGRNATGGLIHIVNAKPGNEFGGFVQGSYGNFDEYRLEGGVNVPLSDAVSTRFSFLRTKRDGFISNAIGPKMNADNTIAGRLQIALRPSDALDILLRGSIYQIKPVTAGAAFVRAGAPDASGLGQPLPLGTPTGYGYVDADGNPFTGAYDDPGLLERKQKDVSARIEYGTGPIKLTSLTSYSTMTTNYREDNDLSPVPFSTFTQAADAHYVTQELRLGKSSGAFRWTTGLYYLSIDGDYRQGLGLAPFATSLNASYSQKTTSYSVFGQGEYDLTDRLTLIGGARYTKDRKRFDYANNCVGPACPAFILPGTIGAAGYRDRHSEGGLSARAQLDFKVNSDVLLYASYNRGYKAFNYNAGFAGQAPIALARFKGEKLNAFEIGHKGDYFDHRVRLNVAAFYYDYQDYQAFDQRGLAFTLFNTTESVYGADAELTVRPGAGFNLSAGVSLLHTKVDNIPLATGLVSREAPQSPKYTLNFAAGKDVDLTAVKLNFTTNATYTAKFFSQLTNAPVTLIPGNWLVNGRIAVSDPEGRVSLAVFAKNLFNERRQTYAFDTAGPPFGSVEEDYAMPRQYGLELRFNF